MSTETGIDRRSTLVLAVLATVAFMAQLDLFVVNVAIPAMGRSFDDPGLPALSWVLNAYAIVFAALLVPAGRYADVIGQRRMLLAGVVVFVIASLGCALAPSLEALVAARVLQAAGAAMIVPTSLSMVYAAFPAHLHTAVVGVWAGVAATAAASGPPVGGLLVGADWRWIFLINVPLGIAVLVTGHRVLPQAESNRRSAPPAAGAVVALLVAIAGIVFVIVDLPDHGVTSTTVVALAAAVVAGAISIAYTARHARPVIDARLFREPAFTRATLALLPFFAAFAAWLLAAVLFLQNVWDYTALQAGLGLAPAPVASAIVALNGGRIARRLGPTLPARLGPAFLAAAALSWLLLAPGEPSYLTGFLPGQILGGIGAGLTQTPLFATAGRLAASDAATGSAILNMARQFGSALGIALLTVVVTSGAAVDLNDIRRGWAIVGVAALLSIAVQIGPRRRALSA